MGGSFSEVDNPSFGRQRAAGAEGFVGARYGWRLSEAVTLSPWFGLSGATYRWWFDDAEPNGNIGGLFPPSAAISMRLTVGAAIEYAFNRHLSVRIATPVVQGAWTRQEVLGDNVDASTSVAVAAVVEPRLELRVYF